MFRNLLKQPAALLHRLVLLVLFLCHVQQHYVKKRQETGTDFPDVRRPQPAYYTQYLIVFVRVHASVCVCDLHREGYEAYLM